MGDLSITLHHDGVFVPNPCKYVNGRIKVLNETRFEEMQVGELFEIINKLTLSNAKHIYYCLPGTTLTLGIREIKTYSDMVEFMRLGYENDNRMELYTEHHGYDVLEYSHNDNLVGDHASDNEQSDDPDYEGESDPENIDFHTKEADDPEDEIIDGMHKADKGIKDPAYDPEQPWNENKPVLGMRYESPQQLKHALANYGLANGIKLWYYRNDADCQCKRAKQLALYEHERGLIEHYGKLWEYRQAVLESNPGFTCHIDQEVLEDDGKIHFTMMYVCFKGLKDGWLAGCRRVIGLDGCFLTHYCKGELLTVVGRDANNQMFPIAWAVVKVENKNNWCWFLSLLCDNLDLQDGLGITIISDGHKRLFWAAASSTVEQNFLNHMDEIKRLDPKAYAYLIGREPGSWCRAFFQPAIKCASFENRISESFNSRLVNARGKPIITMLEDIRVYVFPSGYQVLEVRKKDEAYGVNLIERSYVCKLWGISGIPCVHAVASYMHLHMDPDLGVSSWYSQSKWFDAYQFSIKPVSGSKMWKSTSNTHPLPPLVPKIPGRPRKKRIRHPTENDHEVSRLGRLMTCQLCYETGHNKSSCTRGKQPKPPKPCKPPKPPSNKQYSRMGGIKITDVGGLTSKRGGESVGRGGGSVGRGGGGSVGRGGGSVSRGGGGLVGRGGGSTSKRGGASGLGRGGGSVGRGGGSTSKRGGASGLGRGGGSVGRGGGSTSKRGGDSGLGRGGGSVGRGGGSTSKRGGGSGVVRGGGSVGRGNSKRGGGSVGRGGLKKGGSNSMDTEEEQFRKDQEAQREVMEEVKEAREKERLENEQYARTYCDWEDLQWEGDGFEEPNPNLRLATMSDLVAADEAHDEHFNNMPSLTNDVSLDVSHIVEANNVVPNNEQPTPDAAQTSSQSSRVVLHPRPRSERIAKRRKVNLAAGTTSDNLFTL
ncbi:splicing factor [Tanacetum coccineum]